MAAPEPAYQPQTYAHPGQQQAPPAYVAGEQQKGYYAPGQDQGQGQGQGQQQQQQPIEHVVYVKDDRDGGEDVALGCCAGCLAGCCCCGCTVM